MTYHSRSSCGTGAPLATRRGDSADCRAPHRVAASRPRRRSCRKYLRPCVAVVIPCAPAPAGLACSRVTGGTYRAARARAVCSPDCRELVRHFQRDDSAAGVPAQEIRPMRLHVADRMPGTGPPSLRSTPPSATDRRHRAPRARRPAAPASSRWTKSRKLSRLPPAPCTQKNGRPERASANQNERRPTGLRGGRGRSRGCGSRRARQFERQTQTRRASSPASASSVGARNNVASGRSTAHSLPDPREEPYGDERVTAEVEERVLEPDPFHAEQFAPHAGELLLDLVARRVCARVSRRRRRCGRRSMRAPAVRARAAPRSSRADRAAIRAPGPRDPVR